MVHTQTNRSRTLSAVAERGTTSRPAQPAADAVRAVEAVERIAASWRWRDLATCRDEDPELFFPVGTSGPAKLQEAEAKAVCARCPVRAQCLQDAVENHEDHGVRGGRTEQERRDAIRAARKSSAEESAEDSQPRQSA